MSFSFIDLFFNLFFCPVFFQFIFGLVPVFENVIKPFVSQLEQKSLTFSPGVPSHFIFELQFGQIAIRFVLTLDFLYL